MDYHSKYLKYKKKYLSLKLNQFGGGGRWYFSYPEGDSGYSWENGKLIDDALEKFRTTGSPDTVTVNYTVRFGPRAGSVDQHQIDLKTMKVTNKSVPGITYDLFNENIVPPKPRGKLLINNTLLDSSGVTKFITADKKRYPTKSILLDPADELVIIMREIIEELNKTNKDQIGPQRMGPHVELLGGGVEVFNAYMLRLSELGVKLPDDVINKEKVLAEEETAALKRLKAMPEKESQSIRGGLAKQLQDQLLKANFLQRKRWKISEHYPNDAFMVEVSGPNTEMLPQATDSSGNKYGRLEMHITVFFQKDYLAKKENVEMVYKAVENVLKRHGYAFQ